MMPSVVNDTIAAATALSVEQKTELASTLLSQCPPGEFTEALHDIASILGSEAELASLQSTIEKRNVTSGTLVNYTGPEEMNTDFSIILTEYNQTPDGRFIDQDAGMYLQINPFNLEVEKVEYDEMATSQDGIRMALVSQLKNYIRETLPTGHFNVHYDKESLTYGITIVGEKFQLKNMRNGQWHSKWTLERNEQRMMINGEITLMVHYFEDGNVQLNCKREASFSIDLDTIKEEEDIAKAILKGIRAKEDDVQVALNEAYSQLAESTFKKLRRQLPVTRSKIDWSKLSSYKVSDQLSTK